MNILLILLGLANIGVGVANGNNQQLSIGIFLIGLGGMFIWQNRQ